MKQETLEEAMKKYPLINQRIGFKEGAKWQQKRSYSEEDMEIVEISSSDANYIPHYQTKEGQLLATKFNVKQFKNK